MQRPLATRFCADFARSSWLLRGICVGVLVAAPTAYAQPGLTLDQDRMNATITSENDTSVGRVGDVSSIAPDLAVGVTDDLTVSLVHSTFARTGFRGNAGAGICATDDCNRTYDNVGLEALYALRRGAFAVAANTGIHATSLERGHHVAKLGAKLRYKRGGAVFATLPSVTIALAHRDDPMPNRDRLWLPVTATHRIVGGLSAGLATGFKAPLDDVAGGYEIAAGALAQYAVSPAVGMGASWIHGRLAGGDLALPAGTQGRDFRALHLWVSATY